jgi:hypothetical protein
MNDVNEVIMKVHWIKRQGSAHMSACGYKWDCFGNIRNYGVVSRKLMLWGQRACLVVGKRNTPVPPRNEKAN